MLKLKLQYFGHLMQRVDSLEKTLMLEGIGGRRRRGSRGWDGWIASPTQWTWVWMNSGSWWWTGRPGVLRFMGSQRVGHDWALAELNWRTFTLLKLSNRCFNLERKLNLKQPLENSSSLYYLFCEVQESKSVFISCLYRVPSSWGNVHLVCSLSVLGTFKSILKRHCVIYFNLKIN